MSPAIYNNDTSVISGRILYWKSTAKIIRIAFLLVLSVWSSASGGNAPESICYGTPANGRLENGVKLPAQGNNFQAYGLILHGADRALVHREVQQVVINAYRAMEQTHPDK